VLEPEGDAVRFWLWLNFGLTVTLFLVTGYFLVRRALRERRLTTELALYLATLSLGWMEAVIDWGAFVYYSTMWPHYPVDWPIVRLIPILPLHIPLCYTWFFFGGAWLGVRLARAVTQRLPRLSMDAALIGAGLLVGFLLDFAVENFFISVGGLWTYTQVWGPLSLRGGTDTQWPIYMGFAMALTIAPFTYLLGKRNDRGEDLLAIAVRSFSLGRARALRPTAATSGIGTASLAVAGTTMTTPAPAAPARRGAVGAPRRPSWVLYLLTWVVVVHLVYGVVSLGYAALRWTGVQKTVSTVKPYPDGEPWYDGDVTKPGDPDLNDSPIGAAVRAGL
jgi:Spirocyclase AveC-like